MKIMPRALTHKIELSTHIIKFLKASHRNKDDNNKGCNIKQNEKKVRIVKKKKCVGALIHKELTIVHLTEDLTESKNFL